MQLKAAGHVMLILSCGTQDLIERVLKYAHLDGCFSIVAGNRFSFSNDLKVRPQLGELAVVDGDRDIR